MDADDIESDLFPALQNYSSSYRDIPGIDLTHALAAAILDKYEANNDGDRLDATFDWIQKNIPAQKDEIIQSVLTIIEDYREQINQPTLNELSYHLLKANPEKSRMLYAHFHDPYSLSYILQEATNKIHEALEVLK